MLQNFIDLINDYGCIPNGNRIYYLSRSQPPILALMVELLWQHTHSKTHNLAWLKLCVEAQQKSTHFGCKEQIHSVIRKQIKTRGNNAMWWGIKSLLG